MSIPTVAYFADLPTAVPPNIDSQYLVTNGSGTGPGVRTPSGLYQRINTTGVLSIDWQYWGNTDPYGSVTLASLGAQAAITFGTGVLTALGVNIGSAGAPVLFNGALGTPTSGTLTNCTFPTLNQSTTGSAAKWTTARTLAGNSVDGSANVAFANKFIVQGTADAGLSGPQFLGVLGTGIVKNTTTTGVLSIAVAGDFPALPYAPVAGSSSITTLGTIAAGTWQGTAIADTYIASAATWNGKQAAITFGTGVLSALGANVGSAGAPVLFGGALGTPTSGTLTNCTFPTLNQNTTGSAASFTGALTGDVTSSGMATTISGLALTKLASIADQTILGNVSGSSAAPSALTAANVATFLGLGTAATHAATDFDPAGAAAAITKASIGLGAVENTALSTWAGSANLTTLGTIAMGVWNGMAIDKKYLQVFTSSVCTSDSSALLGIKIPNGQSFAGIADQTSQLQALLDLAITNPIIVIWDGAYSTTGLKVYSNTQVVACPGCGAVLRSYGTSSTTYNPIFGNANPSASVITEQNIKITGGTWNANAANQPHDTIGESLSSAIRIAGVNNLVIEDVTVLDSATYAVWVLNWTNISIRNVMVDQHAYGTYLPNQDGIHLNGPGNFGFVENITGNCSDDVVAINADDGPFSVSWYAPGAITNIAVRNIFINNNTTYGNFGIRILSTVSLIDNLLVDGVFGLTNYHGITIGNDVGYVGGYGNFCNVTLRNIAVKLLNSGVNIEVIRFTGTVRNLTIQGIHDNPPFATPWLLIDSNASINNLTTDLQQTTTLDFNAFSVSAGATIRSWNARGQYDYGVTDVSSSVFDITSPSAGLVLSLCDSSIRGAKGVSLHSSGTMAVNLSNVDYVSSSGLSVINSTTPAIVNLYAGLFNISGGSLRAGNVNTYNLAMNAPSAFAFSSIYNSAATGGSQLNLVANLAAATHVGSLSYSPGSYFRLATDSSDPILLSPNGSTIVSADPTGVDLTGTLRVGGGGIGRSNAAQFRSANVTKTSTLANLIISTSDTQASDIGGSLGLGGDVGGGDNIPFAWLSGRKENGLSGNYAGYFSVVLTDSGGGVTERLRITSTGSLIASGIVRATSNAGLPSGTIWADTTGGFNILKIV